MEAVMSVAMYWDMQPAQREWALDRMNLKELCDFAEQYEAESGGIPFRPLMTRLRIHLENLIHREQCETSPVLASAQKDGRPCPGRIADQEAIHAALRDANERLGRQVQELQAMIVS